MNKFGIEKVLVFVLKNDEDILHYFHSLKYCTKTSNRLAVGIQIKLRVQSGNVEVMLSVAGGRKTRIRED